MYNLVGSFMDSCYPVDDNYETEHHLNIKYWGYDKLSSEESIEVCDELEGYGYFYGYLVTFSEAINGMVEYKVWRKVL